MSDYLVPRISVLSALTNILIATLSFQVNVIFAITENLMEYYNNLHRVLDKFTFIAKLENDSSNILKLVKKGYDDIVSVINFKDDIGEGALNIKYLTNCGDEDAPVIETTMCTDVEFGKTVNFEVHISLDECVELVKVSKYSTNM